MSVILLEPLLTGVVGNLEDVSLWNGDSDRGDIQVQFLGYQSEGIIQFGPYSDRRSTQSQHENERESYMSSIGVC